MTFGEWLDNLIRQVRHGMEANPRVPVPPPPADLLAYHPDVPVGYFLYGWLEWIGMPGWKEEGAARIRRLLRDAGPGGLARLDEQFRRHLWIYGRASGPQWLNPAARKDHRVLPTDPAAVDALELPAELAPWGFGVLAMHPSGYVREAAVRRLAALRGGEELPFLLLRANDWIAPVRERAARAVIERAAPENAPRFVHALRLVLRLEESERRNASPVLAAVDAALRAPGARPALLEALRSPDRLVRRRAFAFLAEDATGDALYDVVVAGGTSGDLGLRRAAARAARRLDQDRLREIFPWLMRIGGFSARVDVLAAAETMGAEGERWIRAAALDRSAMVRGAARSILKSRGVADFAALYRRALETDGADAEGALLGLGETGGADDSPLVERFLGHPRTRVRAAAAESLLRLRRDQAVPLVLPLLGDESAHVVRAVRTALERRPVPRAAVAELFAAGRPPHVRRNALALLARGSKWESIAWILRAVMDGEPRVADDARTELRRWRAGFNRSFQSPLPDQLAAMSAAVEAAAERIDPEMLRWLRATARPLH